MRYQITRYLYKLFFFCFSKYLQGIRNYINTGYFFICALEECNAAIVRDFIYITVFTVLISSRP